MVVKVQRSEPPAHLKALASILREHDVVHVQFLRPPAMEEEHIRDLKEFSLVWRLGYHFACRAMVVGLIGADGQGGHCLSLSFSR